MTIGLAPQNEALRVEAAPLAMLGPGVVVLGTKYCWRQGLGAAGGGLAVLATCPASAARHRTSRCGRWIPCKIYVGYSYCCNFFPRVSWCILSGPFLPEHPAVALRVQSSFSKRQRCAAVELLWWWGSLRGLQLSARGSCRTVGSFGDITACKEGDSDCSAGKSRVLRPSLLSESSCHGLKGVKTSGRVREVFSVM